MSKGYSRLNQYINITELQNNEWTSLVGLTGEKLAIERLRNLYPYPFKIKIKLYHREHKPDIYIKIRGKWYPIEVKYWPRVPYLTQDHCKKKLAHKNWSDSPIRAILFILPIPASELALNWLRENRITFINGLGNLQSVLIKVLNVLYRVFPEVNYPIVYDLSTVKIYDYNILDKARPSYYINNIIIGPVAEQGSVDHCSPLNTTALASNLKSTPIRRGMAQNNEWLFLGGPHKCKNGNIFYKIFSKFDEDGSWANCVGRYWTRTGTSVYFNHNKPIITYSDIFQL